MTITIRSAGPEDIDTLAALMLEDAQARCDAAPALWRMASDAREKSVRTLRTAMQAETPPFRQHWLIAEKDGRAVGTTHSILLPVPPIYAGEFGPPGLVMEDCHVTADAPPGTRGALLNAAEADLVAAGARLLLASGVLGGEWAADYAEAGYDPLTLYFSKTGLTAPSATTEVRLAGPEDLPGIVAASAEHRRVLEALHPRFWKPHPEADARFGGWMSRSLTLTDRDMFVSEGLDGVSGYAISQPATPMHFPVPHDISGIGIIDDFYHGSLSDPASDAPPSEQAMTLVSAAEAARANRGDHSVLVVCPAAWRSKIALLERLGYTNAITWHIRFPD